jgi:hypothetical protein
MTPGEDIGKRMFLEIVLQNVNEGTQWTAHSNKSSVIVVGQKDPAEALRLALVHARGGPMGHDFGVGADGDSMKFDKEGSPL